MSDDDERARLMQEWQALLKAARASHKPGPGGAAICICGAACGGSEACNMLGRLQDLIRYLPVDEIPRDFRQMIHDLRRVI